MRSRREFKPFAARGRRAVAAILVTFAAFSVISVTLSTSTTSRSKNRASVVEVAARQRTLAERYVKDVLLARAGAQADPTYTAGVLSDSANALLRGGTAPAVKGDDDETKLAPATDPTLRAQLEQERRLVADLTATGRAVLAHRRVAAVRLKAHERIQVGDPVQRLRVLAALTSNVSLNAARTIATGTDRNVAGLIETQVALGAAGLLVSLLLAWALVAATRRQTAHFRSLVTSSTDLVLVFGPKGCRYASESVKKVLGRPDADLLGGGFAHFVHADDTAAVQAACSTGKPHEILFRTMNKFGEWRHLQAYVTDLRGDRHISGVVLNARDVTERVDLEEELTRQAFHDSLTGLANRALFRDRLDQALARSARSLDVLSLLLVDLDGFKQVNDSLGHDAGDQLLQQVAQRFESMIRTSDTLARLGGDEFALLLEGASQAQAVMLARRLLEGLSEPVQIAGRELALPASIGIVLHSGGPGNSEELIRHADVAMYAAKEGGRARYEVFHHDMARELGEMLGLEHELRQALQRGEFSLYYQPEVNADSGVTVGVEALVRWHSPTRGLVMPDDFIPVAEASGLIIPLGDFVLREACTQTSRWLGDGVIPESFVTWVNLSGKQLSSGGIRERVREALDAAALLPSMLGLEVTETAIVREGAGGDQARAELQELHEQGVRIAIDDFGTGFSSLGHLRRFPVDLIKVDRSFVQGVEHDAKDAAITANLASLAHALGLVAIAEGIESDGQLDSVRELGCDLVQGYLFAHPMPADEMSRVLAQGLEPVRRQAQDDSSAAPSEASQVGPAQAARAS
jgi:diguanylate cyclase (GGDEF)-like protein/PAS domain S-box-containing protein